MSFLATPASTVPIRRRSAYPRQRAVFAEAHKVEAQIVRYMEQALQEMRDSADLDELARLAIVADPETIFAATHPGGYEAVVTGLEPRLEEGLALGAPTAAKETRRVVVLDMGRPGIQRWIKNETGMMVTNMTATSKEGLRITLQTAIRQGRHPRQIAKAIKGSIGLTRPHAVAVSRFFSAQLQDGVPFKQAEKAAQLYADRLIKVRAENIARTESMSAINHGRRELWLQLRDDGAFEPDQMREWLTADDDAVCKVCLPMDGQKRRLDEPFVTPAGRELESPGAHNQCRCTEVLL